MKLQRDEENQLVESLPCLGLTRYESLVYIGLRQMIGATASEIMKSPAFPGHRFIRFFSNR
jgi:hypothetical protein